jgi:glutamate formiminotransferase/formiminotetrahydrofolate cyclodeaminase
MKYFKDSDELVECIPNFSEGRDKKVIQAIADAIESTPNVRLLHLDSGFDANRTVVTFAGKPAAVVEAAFKAIQVASETIDMRQQKGAHPRMGATDVCPLVPLKNISMESVNHLANQLGNLVGHQLNIPVYMYEKSAKQPKRANLAYLRKGEYESISTKIRLPEWLPDYGPNVFNEASGMTAIGARDFLIAYNVNLNTTDDGIAKHIAEQVRESGFIENGIKMIGHHQIKGLKAIGWLMPSYGCAQVSTNITNIKTAPIHVVYETIKSVANQFGISVTGSELIGLIPEQILLDAGQFYSSTQFHEDSKNNLINLSVNNLGLSNLSKFINEERILENLL